MSTYLGVLPVWERVTLDIFSYAPDCEPRGVVQTGPMALQSVSVEILRPQPGRKGAVQNNDTAGMLTAGRALESVRFS